MDELRKIVAELQREVYESSENLSDHEKQLLEKFGQIEIRIDDLAKRVEDKMERMLILCALCQTIVVIIGLALLILCWPL